MWKIPLSDISFCDKEMSAIQNVIRSGWLTMGKVTQNFETQFASFLGVKHAIAVSNCTAALHLANIALGIGPGDEVICPSLTFVAGANSITYTKATPVFADIVSCDDLSVSPQDIENKITEKTKAIQVMHYAGFACDMKSIIKIAKIHNLYVIEDCAHAPGAESNSKKCGTIGDIGCFSFFSNKNMTTGEGGMVTTNDDEIDRKVRLMRSHGMTTLTWERFKGHAFSYDVVEPGFNYRIDEIRSAIGLTQLDKLLSYNARRKKLSALYRKYLTGISELHIPFQNISDVSTYHIFPIILHKSINRSEFMKYLKKHGIQTSIHYPPLHKFDYYHRLFGKKDGLTVTEEIAKREVTLPLFPNMQIHDVCYIIDKIICFLKKSKSKRTYSRWHQPVNKGISNIQ